MNLSNVSTKQLIEELVNREGVEKIKCGEVGGYKLTKKYGKKPNDRNMSAVALLIDNYEDSL